MKIPMTVSRTIGRHILTVKQNSPVIFFAAGVTSIVAGTVLACRSTLKLHETLDSVHDNLALIKSESSKNAYDEQTRNKDVAVTYLRGAYSVGKLYAPAIALTGFGLASVTGSHVILTRRNAAVAAAYAAVTRSYDEYRGRIQTEIGDDRELELYHAIEWADVEGSDGMVQEPVNAPGSWGNPYSRFFDMTNPNWTASRETNLFFIQCQETFYNQILQSRGHVFLNEIYSNLGFPHSKEGQLVGWILDYDGEGDGDNYIDFGVHEPVNSQDEDRVTSSFLLDFNVDGVVLNKIRG